MPASLQELEKPPQPLSAASGDACETSLSDLWGTCVYLNQPRGEQGHKLLICSPHKQLQSYT